MVIRSVFFEPVTRKSIKKRSSSEHMWAMAGRKYNSRCSSVRKFRIFFFQCTRDVLSTMAVDQSSGNDRRESTVCRKSFLIVFVSLSVNEHRWNKKFIRWYSFLCLYRLTYSLAMTTMLNEFVESSQDFWTIWKSSFTQCLLLYFLTIKEDWARE